MSDGKTLNGQILEGRKKLPVQFTHQMRDKANADALLGNAYTEIQPNDQGSSQVEVFAANASAFEAVFDPYPGYMPLRGIPDVLRSFSITFEKGGGDADATDVVTADGAGSSFSVSVSGDASAQASAFCVAKPVLDIKRYLTDNLPVMHYFFYLANPTLSSVLARLGAGLGRSVTAWPTFYPESHVVSVVNMRTSARAQRTYRASYSLSSGGETIGYSNGTSKGFDSAPSVDTIQIPAMLHGSINLTSTDSTYYTATGTVTVTAGFLSGGGTATAQATAVATASPATLNATYPSAPPTSGEYLYSVDVEPEDSYGYSFVHAIVFDFVYLT